MAGGKLSLNKQKRKLILVLSAIVFAVSLFTAFFGFTGTEYCLSVKNLIKNGEKVVGVYTKITAWKHRLIHRITMNCIFLK